MAKISPLFHKFCSILQYQYRFFNIAIAIASALCAVVFIMDILEKKVVYFIIALLCCFVLYQDFLYFGEVGTESVYLDYIDMELWKDYQMGKAEYLPAETDMEKLTDEVEYEETLQVEQVVRNDLAFDLSVTNEEDMEQNILLPVLYYSGYQTRDIQSREKLETVKGDNGRVMVKIPAHYTGTVHMAFHEPWHWRASEMVSLFTLIVMILFRKKESIQYVLRKE